MSNFFKFHLILLSAGISFGIWYFIGDTLVVVFSWTFPYKPLVFTLTVLFVFVHYIVAALAPMGKKTSKTKARFRCLGKKPKPAHVAGHLAMKHYLSKHSDSDICSSPVLCVAHRAISGCVGQMLVSGDDIDVENDDYKWLSIYLASKKTGFAIYEVTMSAKAILVEYPLKKMADQILTDTKNERTSGGKLLAPASGRGKIGGAYDDVELMPYMDR